MSERDDLLESLAAHRGFLIHTVQGITDDQARQRLTVSELTLGGLIKHVAMTEKGWADFVVDGPVTMAMTEDSYAEHADGFVLREDETLAGVLAEYEKIAARTDELVRTCDLDAEQPLARGAVVPAERHPLGAPGVRAHRGRDRAARGARGHPAGDPRRSEDDGLSRGDEKTQILTILESARQSLYADVRRRHRGAGPRDAHGQRALPRRHPQARRLRGDDLDRLRRRGREGGRPRPLRRELPHGAGRHGDEPARRLRRRGEAHRGGDHLAARSRRRPTSSPRRPGTRRTRPGRRGRCSCTSCTRPPSTPGTRTSSRSPSPRAEPRRIARGGPGGVARAVRAVA